MRTIIVCVAAYGRAHASVSSGPSGQATSRRVPLSSSLHRFCIARRRAAAPGLQLRAPHLGPRQPSPFLICGGHRDMTYESHYP